MTGDDDPQPGLDPGGGPDAGGDPPAEPGPSQSLDRPARQAAPPVLPTPGPGPSSARSARFRRRESDDDSPMMDKLQGYFGLSKTPFGRGLAPGMLHRHAAHSEAIARIAWCVAERALGVVTGEVGVGKTAATRAAIFGLDPARHIVIYLGNPDVGVRGIHTAIVTALGGVPKNQKATLIPQASDMLATEQAERGRTPVLVIDEAHMLAHDQLESVRMLTNFDMDSSSPFATT